MGVIIKVEKSTYAAPLVKLQKISVPFHIIVHIYYGHYEIQI